MDFTRHNVTLASISGATYFMGLDFYLCFFSIFVAFVVFCYLFFFLYVLCIYVFSFCGFEFPWPFAVSFVGGDSLLLDFVLFDDRSCTVFYGASPSTSS